MTKVLFFGKLADDIGERSVEITTQAAASVNDVIDTLAQSHGEAWRQLLTAPAIIAAVDKNITHDRDAEHEAIAEIAFFPPVTGG